MRPNLILLAVGCMVAACQLGAMSFTTVSVQGFGNSSGFFLATVASVPDGGVTLMLLGGALLVVGVLRRRFDR